MWFTNTCNLENTLLNKFGRINLIFQRLLKSLFIYNGSTKRIS